MRSLDPIAIDALLPQTQCTQCGYPGCMPYAEAIATANAAINPSANTLSATTIPGAAERATTSLATCRSWGARLLGRKLCRNVRC